MSAKCNVHTHLAHVNREHKERYDLWQIIAVIISIMGKDLCLKGRRGTLFFRSRLSLHVFMSLFNSLWLVVCGTACWGGGQVLSVVYVGGFVSDRVVNQDEVKCTVKKRSDLIPTNYPTEVGRVEQIKNIEKKNRREYIDLISRAVSQFKQLILFKIVLLYSPANQ